MSKLTGVVKPLTSSTEPVAFTNIRSDAVTFEYEGIDENYNEIHTITCPDELLGYVETMLNSSDGVVSYTITE